MRPILLLVSILISGLMGFFSYQNLTSQISKIDYTVISLVLTIALSFIATHFIYTTLAHKRQTKLSKSRLETLERSISDLTNEKELLEKKVRLMERDLRVSNAKALDHTLHVKASGLRSPDTD